MFRVSDDSGELVFSKVKEGEVTMDDFDSGVRISIFSQVWIHSYDILMIGANLLK